ncbi:HAD family hydrolase [Brachybacterium huguangmaarense]
MVGVTERHHDTPATGLDAFRVHLFDLDGVVTPTAEIHMRAWERMFTEVLRERGIDAPYTDADYFAHIDGKPRYDGVRSFLASRGIELPEGDPGDAPDAETVAGLGNRKNDMMLAMVREQGVEPYPGTVAYLDHLDAAVPGARLAIVSSSRNAEAVLAGAGLRDRFELVVDGNVAAQEGLPGKPAPDTYLHAARLLGADAAGAVVYEDAVSGVAAGAAGAFGAVVGVDRGAGREALSGSGATVVVSDLGELA